MEHAVIIAGGKGERFWPLSRENRPKQLLPLIEGETMLGATINRITPMVGKERTWIVTGARIKDAVVRHAGMLAAEQILLEPKGNNTCMAIGYAAVVLEKHDPDAIMIVLSSDHHIAPVEKLRKIITEGAAIAQRGDHLVTIGITPTRAETGYGYIELGPSFATSGGISSYQVASFLEKPNLARAQEFYYGHRHLWNSGMFIWSAKTILEAIERHAPDMHASLRRYQKTVGTDAEAKALVNLYDETECLPVDVAVLEKADNVVVIKGDLSWDDIGSYLALERINKPDPDHNVIEGRAVAMNTFETTILNEDDSTLIATLGISDLVVVRTNNAVLVAHKTQLGEIRELIDRIRSEPESDEFL